MFQKITLNLAATSPIGQWLKKYKNPVWCDVNHEILPSLFQMSSISHTACMHMNLYCYSKSSDHFWWFIKSISVKYHKWNDMSVFTIFNGCTIGTRSLSHNQGQGPVSLTVFPSQLKFGGNLFYSHLDSNAVIATQFCTWHDSCAVVACAKMCCNLIASSGITARRSFHRIWNEGKIRYWNGRSTPVAPFTNMV